MTQEDTSRKAPPPKDSSENLLARSRRDFEQALERGESPRIEDCFGDVSGAERERLLQEASPEKRFGPRRAPSEC